MISAKEAYELSEKCKILALNEELETIDAIIKKAAKCGVMKFLYKNTLSEEATLKLNELGFELTRNESSFGHNWVYISWEEKNKGG